MNLINIGTELYRHTNPCLFDTAKYAGDTGTPDFMTVDNIIGGTVAWNQLILDGNFTSASNWVKSSSGYDLTVSNNVGKVTITDASFNGRPNIKPSTAPVSPVVGHKYFLKLSVKTNTNNLIRPRIMFGGGYYIASGNLSQNTLYSYENVVSVSNAQYIDANLYISTYLSSFTVGDYIEYSNYEIIDLTAMFGSTIADYIYSLETNTTGAGVAWFKALFPKDYYAYDAGSLQSVNTSAHKTYKADNTLLGNYALDSSLTLRGIPKLDANNNLYYDGDSYEASGTVTRKYGIVDLGTLSWSYSAASGTQLQLFNTSGIASLVKKEGTVFLGVVCPKYIAVNDPVYSRTIDKAMCILSSNGVLYIVDSAYTSAADFKTAMNGVYLVYELATPTTETATAYAATQSIDHDGTEEYVDYAYSQGTRDVAIPVGRLSIYYAFSQPRIGDMLIDGESLQAKGWFLKWRKLSAPAPKSDYTSIYGRDGSIDQTEALGDVFYEDRSLYLDMVYNGNNWNDDYSELLNGMHGQKRILQFTDDPWWYWVARLVVTEFSHKEHSLTMSGVAFPYKMSFIQHEYSATVSGATEQTATVLTLAGSRMMVSPKIVSTGTVTIKWGTNTAVLSAGTHYVRGLKVGAEGVTLKVYGTGSVNIMYREGSL